MSRSACIQRLLDWDGVGLAWEWSGAGVEVERGEVGYRRDGEAAGWGVGYNGTSWSSTGLDARKGKRWEMMGWDWGGLGWDWVGWDGIGWDGEWDRVR